VEDRNRRFIDSLSTARFNRRQIIELGLKFGAATTVIVASLIQAADVAAAPAHQPSVLQSAAAEVSSGTFTAIMIDGAPDIDPHSTYVTQGGTVTFVCYEMLIKYKGNSTSEFAPMLASAWTASADNKTYTFTIPSGVLFHDGTTCDAAAVRLSMIRLVRMQLGPYLVLGRFIDNPEEQIVATDANTITFNLPAASPIFLDAMASNWGPYTISPAAVDANKTEGDPWAHSWFIQNAVGTGPYQLTEFDLKNQVVFKKFDGYHGGWDGPHFDGVVLRVVPENATRRQLLEQNQATGAINNVTPDDMVAMQKESSLQIVTYPSTHVSFSILNTAKLNTAARQGLCLAYPYQEVITGVYRDTVKRTGPIPTSVRGYNPALSLPQTDLAKAQTLLAAGGLAAGTTIDMIITSEEETDKSAAELFQSNLAQIGYKLDIQMVDTSTQNGIIFGDKIAAERPMIIGSWAWWPDYNDAWNQISPNFLKVSIGNGGGNAGGYENGQVEALMEQAKNFTDLAQLTDVVTRAQQIMVNDDPAAIFLGERQYFTILQAGVAGYAPNPLYLDLFDIYPMSGPAAS
jgi:peptide/nickel transport system substrate-binding protein